MAFGRRVLKPAASGTPIRWILSSLLCLHLCGFFFLLGLRFTVTKEGLHDACGLLQLMICEWGRRPPTKSDFKRGSPWGVHKKKWGDVRIGELGFDFDFHLRSRECHRSGESVAKSGCRRFLPRPRRANTTCLDSLSCKTGKKEEKERKKSFPVPGANGFRME